jgi:hypothetical protein
MPPGGGELKFKVFQKSLFQKIIFNATHSNEKTNIKFLIYYFMEFTLNK